MTGAEGERKRGLYADLSFGDWRQSKTGDPSVVLTAASSPMRGAKMVRHTVFAPIQNLCREALPPLGEVPSAHTGERGLQCGVWSGGEKT